MQGLKIGELARRTGCQAETIRYYEREGLLPAPGRTDGNYRLYGAAHLERLEQAGIEVGGAGVVASAIRSALISAAFSRLAA